VGDDIAYLKKIGGEVRAVNVEAGIFGIIQDVNPNDDAAIYDAVTSPGEIIFSNILVKDGKPYWLGMGRELPDSGLNFSGEWTRGKTDDNGKEIDPSHKNARFTIRLAELPNCDPRLEDPEGVPIKAIVFGGRDSDTSVPVEQSFDWVHGVITKGASIESESTAATLGAEGVREFNPMSNLDFLAASLDTYIQKYLEFAAVLAKPPAIFAVNYFLKGADGAYLNGMHDKKVWMLWIEERVNGDVGALRTPTGLIPLYKDLHRLFRSNLDMEYTVEQYQEQFAVRVPEQLAKMNRIEEIYRQEWGIPEILFVTLDEQRKRLEEALGEFGDNVSPLLLSQKLAETS
jgi:phosphoenolpyruvate carboxykinase (GTP)